MKWTYNLPETLRYSKGGSKLIAMSAYIKRVWDISNK
jgi:hypothetical protein